MIGSPPGFSLPVFDFIHRNGKSKPPDQSARGSDRIVLMEAAGVEPASENLRFRPSTSVAFVYVL